MKIEKDKFSLVRMDRAGVFFGHIEEVDDKHIVMTNVRKIYYWAKAACVEQLAVDGEGDTRNAKYTIRVDRLMMMDKAIQIFECTDKATKSLNEVPEWKM